MMLELKNLFNELLVTTNDFPTAGACRSTTNLSTPNKWNSSDSIGNNYGHEI